MTRKFNRSLVIPLTFAAMATTGLVALTSGAFFTASDSVNGDTFTAGTVSLAAAPTTAAISMPAMAPGDKGFGTVTVTNSGSLAQRYAMLSTVTDSDGKGLGAALQAVVKTGVTACTAAGFDTTGTVVYGPATLGSAAGLKMIGDSAQGAQTGDRVLSAGDKETLCMKVTLPTTAGNALQGATTGLKFTFNAEQVTNNP